MQIAISGTPGVGKTTIAERLAKKLNYRLISVNNLAEKLDAYTGYDKKRQAKILDMDKLKKELQKIKENIIIEGHASHEFPVDIVIILRCEPPILEKRLKERYPKNPEKIKENIKEKAVMQNKKVYEIDISKNTPDEIVNSILEILDGKEGYEVGKIDWLEKYYQTISKPTESS